MGYSRTRSDRRVVDYLRTIGTAPGFEWRLLSFTAFFSATYMSEGWRTALAVAGAAVLVFLPLGFLFWRRGGRPSPMAIEHRTRGRTHAHPWLFPIARFAIALTFVLTAALVGSAAGLTAASYVALVAAVILIAVVTPVFAVLVIVRSDKPRYARRGRRR